jgi:hypothetical protein
VETSDNGPLQPIVSPAEPKSGDQTVSLGESIPKAQPQKPFECERDRIDKFEICSRLVLTLAAVVIAVVSVKFQREDQQHAAYERKMIAVDQIRAKYIAAEGAHRTYQTQAVASLVPLALSGTVDQRRKALSTLAKIAPSVAMALTEVLSRPNAGTSREEQELARTINDEASERETDAAFMDHLEIAREFFGRGFSGEACTEFLKAWDGLPSVFQKYTSDKIPEAARTDVDYKAAEAGQKSCTEPGRSRDKGATDLQEAFKRIQTP